MLYSAYIRTKGTKEKKGMNIAFLMKGKQKVPTKKRNYIYTYIVKKRKGCKRAQKKGLCNIVPNNPESVRLLCNAFFAFINRGFRCFAFYLRGFILSNLLLKQNKFRLQFFCRVA